MRKIFYLTLILVVAAGSAEASTQAWVWANNPAATSYSPPPTHSYNPAGGAITITRGTPGAYNVRFSGLVPMVHAGGNVQVSVQGQTQPAAICRVGTWSAFGTQDMNINVRCTTPTGTPANTIYTLLFTFN